MLSSAKHQITDFLAETYPASFTSFKMTTFRGDIGAFFFYFNSAAELEKSWNKISGNIAGLYQATLADNFTKWNIYIFYLCGEPLTLQSKYKIINDRFSSRKIVADSFTRDVDEITLADLIMEYITNSDIFHSNTPRENLPGSDYSSTSIVWETIKDIQLRPGKGGTGDTERTLTYLETKLHENSKS